MRKLRGAIDGPYPVSQSYGMYKSTDGGETWVKINNGLETSLININCIAVHPTNSDIVYIGTWRDGVFKTIDGGQTWVLKSNGLASADVRSLAIDPKNPEVVYAGLGDGVGIFKTTNGGELWGEINTGLSLVCPSNLLPAGKVKLGISLEQPSKRVSSTDYYLVPWTSIWSIVIDPTNSQIIYAGDHQSGVYMSTDGGSTWVPINEGLSTRAVTAMAISSDGKVLYAATEGEGVFRLGEVPEVIFVPTAPSGPTDGITGTTYTFSISGSISNIAHALEYQFDWKGDGSDLSPWGSATQSKTWIVPGIYNVKARARCTQDTSVVSDWSSGLSVTISAETVSMPNTPSGPTVGTTGKNYNYSAGGSSSNLIHLLEYQFDWKGDGSDLSAWGSGAQSKTWTVPGIYNVKVRARCATDTSVMSDWSNPLSVIISVPDISITPNAYNFGSVKVKRSKTASFNVKNNGTGNLSINSRITDTDASMFKITMNGGSKTIKPGKTLTIKVAFKPTSTGTKSSALRVTSNDPLTPTVDIQMSGTGQ